MPLVILLAIINGVYWIYRASKLILILAIIARVVGGLGLAVTSVVGVDFALDSLRAVADENLNGLPADVHVLVDMAGITTILGWLISAMLALSVVKAARVAVSSLQGMYPTGGATGGAGGSGGGLSVPNSGSTISNF